ncbi:MAG: SDR family oxidoreductase [Rhodospirillales bacterium]|nr:MAG: SDR family oxidoreductase [Rhodospirillales bacterium]
MTSDRLFILGLGDSALRLARRARARGFAVAGTVRGGDKARALRAEGIEAVPLVEGGADAARAALSGATHVLGSIPPDDSGDPGLTLLADDVARAAPRWLGYLGTTGVYGDRGGGWVDEDAPVAPSSERARRRVVAEAQWTALGGRVGRAPDIFRLPGIYGPGRSALDQVRAGTARRVDKPGQMFSRIHVDDIGTAVLAAIDRGGDGRIYNVADDEPAPQADVVAFACALLGIEPPPLVPYTEIEASLSPMARSFYAESRRVRNDRLRRELGVALAYPTYREGLLAIHAAETAEH